MEYWDMSGNIRFRVFLNVPVDNGPLAYLSKSGPASWPFWETGILRKYHLTTKTYNVAAPYLAIS